MLYAPAGIVKTYFMGRLMTSVMGTESGGNIDTVLSLSTLYTHHVFLKYSCLCHFVAPDRNIACSA